MSSRVLRMRKLAEGQAGLIPQIQVRTAAAQEKHTLPGMVPPAPYAQVNTDTPPTPDAGSQPQKSLPPMGAQMLPKVAQVFSREGPEMNVKPRVLVQDLVKDAMSKSAQRQQVATEGARQMKLAESNPQPVVEETQESIPTDYAMKLANAVEWAIPHAVAMAKAAEMPPPPGVSASTQSGSPPGPGGQGKGHQQPPMNPPMESATKLESTINHPPGGTGTQTTAMSGGKGKVASPQELFEKNLARLSGEKVASGDDLAKKNLAVVQKFAGAIKAAEDPDGDGASVSGGGGAVAPQTSASGESGGAPAGGMPQGPHGLVGSNESAMNFKRNQAHNPRKAELHQYFNEPALSSQTDTTLQQAFAHTGEAGTKFSSAQVNDVAKTAAARAFLSKLADDAKKKEEAKKKDKEPEKDSGAGCY